MHNESINVRVPAYIVSIPRPLPHLLTLTPLSMSDQMSTLPLLPSLVLLTFLTSTTARPSKLSNLTYQQLTICHSAENTCRECWNQCPSNRHPFFASEKNTQTHEDLVVSLQECLRETIYYRQWLPNWCINDQNGFFATHQFPPTEQNCLMQPYACSQHIENFVNRQVQEKKLPSNHGRYKLALKIGQLGRLQRNLTAEIKAFEERKKKLHTINQAWEERWLEEADFHINNPEENVTKYADPVFHNFRNLLKENQDLDMRMSSSDLFSATIQNKFVRRDTVDRIPSYLRSIQQLKNQIHSKKNQTDLYLEEIKQIAARTFVLQEKATNIIYETTHAKQLDGDIVVLDNELLALYTELKRERAKLRELNVRTTFAKLRLVGIMRMAIQQITHQQLRKGCSSSEVMGF